MTTNWRIVRRAYSKYEQVAECDSRRIALEVADDLERGMKDGEYLVRREDEPDEGFPIKGYLEQGVSD